MVDPNLVTVALVVMFDAAAAAAAASLCHDRWLSTRGTGRKSSM